MNKARRHELKMLKYKRRLLNLNIKDDTKGKFFAYRSHGSPCSCYMCQGGRGKYRDKRNKNHDIHR